MGERIYGLCPGAVRSINDGQVHYIGAGDLAKLYGLQYGQYRVVRNGKEADEARRNGMKLLFPREDGNYQLPKETGDG